MPKLPVMPRLPTLVAVALALALAAQAHALDIPRDIPDRWMPEPSRSSKILILPPIRELPIRPPPIRVPVELRGYIQAVVVDPVDPLRMPGRTEYYFYATSGQIYRLDLSRATFYLCSPWGLMDYVGTGKLVVVRGYLVRNIANDIYGYHLLIATEVRDPAYPRCR